MEPYSSSESESTFVCVPVLELRTRLSDARRSDTSGNAPGGRNAECLVSPASESEQAWRRGVSAGGSVGAAAPCAMASPSLRQRRPNRLECLEGTPDGI